LLIDLTAISAHPRVRAALRIAPEDGQERSCFLEELTGKVHLTQYEAVSGVSPSLARRALDARRLE